MALNVYKRGSTWTYHAEWVTAAGKREQEKRGGFRTKALALEHGREAMADVQRGVHVKRTRMTVATFLTDQWLPTKASTLKATTLASYTDMVGRYIVPRIGAVPLAALDGPTLNALYRALLASGGTGGRSRKGGRGLSAKSVRNVHGLLHKACKDAMRWGHLRVNPTDAADPPRVVVPERDVWTLAQLATFVDSVAEDRLYAMWLVFAMTGMRRGEACGLRWDDVDLDAGRLAIRSTRTVARTVVVDTPKSRAGGRTVAIDADTVAALKAWRQRQREERLMMGAGWRATGLVFTTPTGEGVHPRAVSRWFLDHVAAAGLPRIRLHDVRHSYADGAHELGVPLRQLSQRLGHADTSVTLRVYTHFRAERDAAAADMVAGAITSHRRPREQVGHTVVSTIPTKSLPNGEPHTL